MLNRSLVVLRAKQPFLDWLRGLPDPVDDLTTLESVNEENSAYLLPMYEEEEERAAILEEVFGILFEDQLNGWWTDERQWPKERTLQVFTNWFELDWHSIVEDLVDGPLIDDELDLEEEPQPPREPGNGSAG